MSVVVLAAAVSVIYRSLNSSGNSRDFLVKNLFIRSSSSGCFIGYPFISSRLTRVVVHVVMNVYGSEVVQTRFAWVFRGSLFVNVLRRNDLIVGRGRISNYEPADQKNVTQLTLPTRTIC